MGHQRTLRACMQVLVILDLVFVQMTGIAGMHWLAPLFAFAIAAPLLERYRESAWYVASWNLGVVAFFLVLLRHAWMADLAYVLEDGLVLAALCQVHLLNNLRSSQRPDLLFLNAFLIAIITGFMNRGLGFPVVFLAFIPAFVIGLQLLNATRGGHELSGAVMRRLAHDGAKRSGVLLVLSLLAFLFWPRDFERKAFFHGKLEIPTGAPTTLEIGFNEKLVLNRDGKVEGKSEPALRVTLLAGTTADVPALWRGATLGATNGEAWHGSEPATHSTLAPTDERWRGRGGRLVREDGVPDGAARVQVVRFPQQTERLFAPLSARSLRLLADEDGEVGGLLRPRLDGTIDTARTDEVRYDLALATRPPRLGSAPRAELPDALLPYVELPENERNERARGLAARLAGEAADDAEQHRVVTRLSDYLARNFRYLPPGASGAPRTLDEFLRGESGGHCEFFASALATMLRSLGIPCRVVTGLRSTRWDAEERVLRFGSLDAHAWVEVHDPEGGWYAVDPSPLVVEDAGGTGLWAGVRSRAHAAWQGVTRFDAERRAAFFAWVRTTPERLAGALRTHPVRTTLALLLPALAVALAVSRRRARTDARIRAYRASLRRASLRPLPGETPRELLARARTAGLRPERLRELERATAAHEATRYAA